MRTKGAKRCLPRVVPVLLAAVLLLGAAVALNLPRPQRVSDAAVDLSALEDGVYLGACPNGLVYARVEVAVRNHAISEIRLLEHRNGMGAAAESVVDAVVAEQSLAVDAVAGATLSTQTILKAVENALTIEGGT